MKNIVVILESEDNLGQCQTGLMTLADFARRDQIKAILHAKSAHWHIGELEDLLTALAEKRDPYIIIAGADKDAILPGFIDAYLRNELKNTTIPVIGVAFMNEDSLGRDLAGKRQLDNKAAVLSITQGLGTQVRFAGQGADGFNRACVMACRKKSFPAIKLPEIPLSQTMSVEDALRLANELNQKS